MAGDLKARWAALRDRVAGMPVLGVLVRAGLRGPRDHAKDMAASIAFFTFLSLFPLVLGLLSIASSVLKSEAMQVQVITWVEEFFPVGADYVTQNIESLVRLRGAAGVTSVVVLFWSAKKMFAAVSRGINEALGLERSHAAILSPLRSFVLALAVSLLMFGSAALTPLADLVSDLEIRVLGDTWSNVVTLIGGNLVGIATTAILVGFTYMLVPYRRFRFAEIWPGMLTAAVLIQLGKKAFVYWVDNVSSLDAVYGSISTIIALMLWLYFFGRVLLFGAEVNYVYGLDRRKNQG